MYEENILFEIMGHTWVCEEYFLHYLRWMNHSYALLSPVSRSSFHPPPHRYPVDIKLTALIGVQKYLIQASEDPSMRYCQTHNHLKPRAALQSIELMLTLTPSSVKCLGLPISKCQVILCGSTNKNRPTIQAVGHPIR